MLSKGGLQKNESENVLMKGTDAGDLFVDGIVAGSTTLLYEDDLVVSFQILDRFGTGEDITLILDTAFQGLQKIGERRVLRVDRPDQAGLPAVGRNRSQNAGGRRSNDVFLLIYGITLETLDGLIEDVLLRTWHHAEEGIGIPGKDTVSRSDLASEKVLDKDDYT